MRRAAVAVAAVSTLSLLAAGCASGAVLHEVSHVRTSTIAYEHDGEALTGYLSHDPDIEGRRPAVIVIHEWWGLGGHPREVAKDLARIGWVGFAIDMYGTGRLTDDPAQAGEWAGRFRGEGRMLGRARAAAALEVLRNHPLVDPDRIAVIGFCFGGTQAFELAWSGADLRAAVSFHGSPTTPRPEDVAGIRASVLVLHGAEDPFVSKEALDAFETSLKEAKLDWELVKYAGAVHSFTNPAADGSFNPGAKYHPVADRRSRAAMEAFLRERFGEQEP